MMRSWSQRLAMTASRVNSEAHRSVELERIATGRRLRVTEHDTDLHADLIDEDDQGIGAFDIAGDLAQRLRHQTRLQADVLIAHLAFDFSARRQGRHRIDHDDVHGIRAHQHIGDFERLLAGIRLRHQEVFDLNPKLGGVHRIESMFGIDEGGRAALALTLSDDLQGQGRFAGRFRPIDLDDTATRQTTDAKGDVETERPRGDRRDAARIGMITEAHDRTFAELLFNLCQCRPKGLALVLIHASTLVHCSSCHERSMVRQN